jgi:hypothetical protein
MSCARFLYGAIAETVTYIYTAPPVVTSGTIEGTSCGQVKLGIFCSPEGNAFVTSYEVLNGQPPDLLGGEVEPRDNHPLSVTKGGQVIGYLGVLSIEFTPVAPERAHSEARAPA